MKNVLLIEDDLEFASIMKDCLEEQEDIKINAIIDNESEAFQFFQSGHLQGLDCILVDLQLPRYPHDRVVNSSSGLRILQELRQRQHFTGTVIVLTNSKSTADGQRALAAGTDGYLCKNANVDEIQSIIDELKVAIHGHVMMVSNEMRHVFFREDISAKEARLMDLLTHGKPWAEIAKDLGYKTSKAAANVGDRIFDKILSNQDREALEKIGEKKRHMAVDIWRSRYSNAGPEGALR